VLRKRLAARVLPAIRKLSQVSILKISCCIMINLTQF